jgi:geranylgeranylglycerol-phosphate geranylgeranyltransferase
LGSRNRLIEKEQESTALGPNMASKLIAFVELMRVKNLGLALIATPLGAAFALLNFEDLLGYPQVALATMSVLFFMAAGNALNDLSDVEIDKVAHPSRPLADGSITELQAKILIGMLSAMSVASLVGCLYLMDGSQEYTAAIYVSAVLLMLTYDHGPRTKQMGLIGNIAISSLVAAVVLYGASSIGGLTSLLCWYVAGVVFFVNLAREIIKDCQDMEADSDSRQTLPMKIGKENSRMIAYVLTLIGIVFLYIPYWQGPFSFGQLILQSPAIFILMGLNGPMWKGEDYVAATRLRIAMLLGLVGFIVTILV